MRVLYDGHMDNVHIKIRYLEPGDLGEMLKYINALSAERTFITYQGEKITEQQEIEYIARQLKKMREKKCVNLVVEVDSRIIGNSQIVLGDRTTRHIGEFGISLLRDFRNKGIGKLLLKLVVEQALDELAGLEIILLNVFGKNNTAREIYKKFGFVEFGLLPLGVKLEDGWDDYIYMYKKVK